MQQKTKLQYFNIDLEYLYHKSEADNDTPFSTKFFP